MSRLYQQNRLDTAWLCRAVCVGLLGSLWVGCADSPARRLDDKAADLGFSRQVLKGKGFEHVVYIKRNTQDHPVLHVYLEGDGAPWIQHRWVAADPTPRRPMMLDLMSLDPYPSVYLGRPCYNGLAHRPPCQPGMWTEGRYSPAVIDAMAGVLGELLGMTGQRRVMLFGYSGGGALAMLLAERFPQTVAVVTIAGNLDTEAWTRHHGYSPLRTSLNPARRPPLAIRQLHLAGGDDRVVPPALLSSVLDRPGVQLRVIEGYDHRCCWRRIWPQILAEIGAWQTRPLRVPDTGSAHGRR